MNKQEKIDKIYEVMARKNGVLGEGLLDGNKVRILNEDQYEDIEGMCRSREGVDIIPIYNYDKVMIGTVLWWMENNGIHLHYATGKNEIGKRCSDELFYIINLWSHKEYPIEMQLNVCIDYIYNLIK